VTELAELQICLLGSFQVCWDFVPVSTHVWRSPWAPKLLKLALLMRPGTVSAVEAVRLLDSGLRSATIDDALDQVRRVLEPAATIYLDEKEQIRFEPGPHCWIDLDTFLGHYESGIRSAGRGEMLPAVMAFQEADGLYQGDLLEETQEAWVFPHRKRLQALYTEILERLAEGHAVLARYQDAVGFCYKALAHDPLRETTYQRMMVYYYYLGDMAGAEAAYLACREALENGSRHTSGETDDLWTRLNRAELPASPGVAAAPTKRESRKTSGKS
jgi:DNA-binding SARP family transcriptional activator